MAKYRVKATASLFMHANVEASSPEEALKKAREGKLIRWSNGYQIEAYPREVDVWPDSMTVEEYDWGDDEST